MKRFFASLVMGLALAATPAISAAQSVAKAPAKQKSLAQNGRFHQFHAQKFAIDCATCHKPEQQEVLLQVSRDRIVDRRICLDCHKYWAKSHDKPGWYGVEAR
jgi:cytochrome c553